ncbi:MAG: 1-acyl-sn-glycerol-3-phosphate acyltransferase [Methylobacteriaceae bacterium]|nr:1-acyl-sn-glycerol-3-phosphate acyltransferase [Methylobacteriaceae bacterium]
MLALRSLVFNVAFYVNLIAAMLVGLPTMLMGRRAVMSLARYWGRSSIWLARLICGLDVEYRGVSNIPKGAILIAPKHQSIWETFGLLEFFDDFSFVLKRELTWIPFFGWYLLAAEQIAINRSQGSSALAQVSAAAQRLFAEGRQVYIFPEGTRRPVGAPPAYKYGVAQVYASTGVKCLPVALNAGLFWPRRSFLRKPGKILVEFLPVIEPGLDARSFLAELTERLESATDRLVAESLARHPGLSRPSGSLPPARTDTTGETRA